MHDQHVTTGFDVGGIFRFGRMFAICIERTARGCTFMVLEKCLKMIEGKERRTNGFNSCVDIKISGLCDYWTVAPEIFRVCEDLDWASNDIEFMEMAVDRDVEAIREMRDKYDAHPELLRRKFPWMVSKAMFWEYRDCYATTIDQLIRANY